MNFLSPERLLLLLLLAALAATYVIMQTRRGRYAVRFTNLELLHKVAPLRPGWRRHVPGALFLIMLGLMITGFARPTASVQVPREQATIMLAIDVSGSMRATDVEPDRLTAAKRGARSFVDKVPGRFNVGVVAFAASATVVVSPTTDRQAIRSGIDNLTLGPRTAIGEGIITSLQAIANFGAQFGENSPPARIVLLSDGTNTAGRTPEVAATRAVEARVPVWTIAYGTPNGTMPSGGQQVPVPVDGAALERIADTTGGRFYEAESSDEVKRVYSDIGSSVGHRTERREVWAWFIGFGLLSGCVAAAGSLAWFSRIP